MHIVCAVSVIDSILLHVETQCGVQTKIQAIDFSRADDPAWDALIHSLAPLEVGVLGKELESMCYFDFLKGENSK